MLSKEVILEKTKSATLEDVKHLNMWGAKLNNISMVSKLPNLEVLALSVNNITSIEPIASCRNLKELYLRKNDIADIAEVGYLRNLPLLQTLWLLDNPCATHPHYRNFVIRCCPRLQTLDNVEVSKTERSAARDLPDSVMKEILNKGIVPASGGSSGAAPLPLAGSNSQGSSPSAPARAGSMSKSRPSATPQQCAMHTAIAAMLPVLDLPSLEALQVELAEHIVRAKKAAA